MTITVDFAGWCQAPRIEIRDLPPGVTIHDVLAELNRVFNYLPALPNGLGIAESATIPRS
jgi:hypothetical protein